MLHALDTTRHLYQLGPERGGDELSAAISLRAHHCRDSGAVLRVKRRVNLVEEVEGHWVATLDGEDEANRHHRLLTAAELLHHHRLALAEGHLDLHAGILLHEAPRFLRRRGVSILGIRSLPRLLALHD